MMNFWLALALLVVATGVVFAAVSINGVTEPPTGGHDHGGADHH